MSEFNEDEEWSLEDYQRQLLQMCENEALKRAREEGIAKGLAKARREAIAEGRKKAFKEYTLRLYQKKYPNEDTKWLENLTRKQYGKIFDKLLNDESLDEIKKIIEE